MTEEDRLQARRDGRAVNGTVDLEHFDVGMATTLGAVLSQTPGGDLEYHLPLSTVPYPPGYPGIPVYYESPEDAYGKWVKPCIFLVRESQSPALSRRMSGTMQYSAPAPGSQTRTLRGQRGVTQRVRRPQATPTDITYSLKVMAERRPHADLLLRAVLSVFQPDGMMALQDSIGDERTYDAYMEGFDPLDDIFDVGERTVGYNVTVRVEGEYDSYPETVATTLHGALTLRPRGR